MSIKNIIFDFFDVVHSDPQKAWLAANGLALAGPFAHATALLDTGRITYREYLEHYGRACGKNADEMEREFKRFYRLHDGVVKVIGSLGRQGYQLCLLSNTTTSEIKPLLKKHGLEPLFHEIIISSEVGIRKPDPQLFRLALTRLSARPEETVFIDDSQRNVDAAKRLGINGICYTDDHELHQDLWRAGLRFGETQ